MERWLPEAQLNPTPPWEYRHPHRPLNLHGLGTELCSKVVDEQLMEAAYS